MIAVPAAQAALPAAAVIHAEAAVAQAAIPVQAAVAQAALPAQAAVAQVPAAVIPPQAVIPAQGAIPPANQVLGAAITILSEDDVREFAAIIAEPSAEGGAITLLWRTRRRNRFVKEGEWTLSTAKVDKYNYEYVEKAAITLDEDQGEWTSPFPNPDVEYGELSFVAPLGMPGRKRAREEQAVPRALYREEIVAPEAKLFAVAAKVLLDSKIGKPTVEISNSGGLRIPAEIESERGMHAAMIPFWIQRVLSSPDSRDEIATEWRTTWTIFKGERCGPITNNENRRRLESAIDSMIRSLYAPPPVGRRAWLSLIGHAIDAMRIIMLVGYGAESARKLDNYRDLVEEKNLYDPAEIMRSAESPSTNPVKQPGAAPVVSVIDFKNLVDQVTSFSSSFRGRGNNRGGRGGRSNYNQ